MRALTEVSLENEVRRTFPTCPEDVLRDFLRFAKSPTERIEREVELQLSKPYGKNLILRTTRAFGVSMAVFQPGQSTSYHCHRVRSELFWVRRGTITLATPDGEALIATGEAGRSVPGLIHALCNRGTEVAEVLEMFVPPLLDDKYRVADRYQRRLGRVGRNQ